MIIITNSKMIMQKYPIVITITSKQTKYRVTNTATTIAIIVQLRHDECFLCSNI